MTSLSTKCALRIKDWLHGLRTAAPDKETQQSLSNEPLTDAERLRIIYLLITGPKEDGGAGITPKQGEWKNVESLFALHDHKYNKEWITRWSKSWYLTEEDLQSIRDRFGEKVGFLETQYVLPLTSLRLHSISPFCNPTSPFYSSLPSLVPRHTFYLAPFHRSTQS